MTLLEERNLFLEEKIAIDEAKALISKYSKQLDNIKNNREYDSLIKKLSFRTLR